MRQVNTEAPIRRRIVSFDRMNSRLAAFPPGTPEAMSLMLTTGLADGYALAVQDIAEWLEARGNKTIADELQRLARTDA